MFFMWVLGWVRLDVKSDASGHSLHAQVVMGVCLSPLGARGNASCALKVPHQHVLLLVKELFDPRYSSSSVSWHLEI